MGRFTQVDPFPGMLGAPATQHPYAYGLNNPVRYSDPSGEFVGALLFSMALAGGIATYQYFQQHPGTTLGCAMQDGQFLRQVGIAALIGGIGYTAAFIVGIGTLAGLAHLGVSVTSWGSAMGVGAIVGATGGGAYQIVANLLTGQPWHQDLGWAMVKGAAFGAVLGVAGYGLQRAWQYFKTVKNVGSGPTPGVIEASPYSKLVCVKEFDTTRVRV